MIRSTALPALVVLVVATSVARAQILDRVKTADGRSTRGTVVQMSATEVVVTDKADQDETISVNKIDVIVYASEPRLLTQARTRMGNQLFEDALIMLSKIDEKAVSRNFIKQDVQFYRALCQARLALGGRGKLSVAGRAMHDFASDADNRDSYHYFEATRVLGELLATSGKHAKAIDYFGRLMEAPLPEYQMRGRVLSARALMAQRKYQDAVRQFDQVLATTDEGDEAERRWMTARLDNAVCLAETEKADEGIQLINEVLPQVGLDERELRARAFRARGLCYLKKDQKKDALLDFLHVDLLYNSVPEIHAEVLFRLSKLWPALGKGQRAREAAKLLKERYPNSRWAKEGT